MTDDAEPARVICVLHLNQLGDLVFSLPTLAALRQGFPEARIASVVRHGLAPLLEESPLVDEVVAHHGTRDFLATAERLRSLEPDLAVCLSESPRSRLLAYLSRASRRVGLDGGPLSGLLTSGVAESGLPSCGNDLKVVRELGLAIPRETYVGLLEATPADREAARRVLLDAGWTPERGRLVVLAPGVSEGREAKRWPPSRYGELAERLTAAPGRAAVVVDVESADEGPPRAPGVVDLAGRTGLRELVGLLSLAELFIGNDSGALHLAACLGVPCVALFGPTDPMETGPHGEGHAVLEAEGGDLGSLPVERVLAVAEERLSGRQSTDRGAAPDGGVISRDLRDLEAAVAGWRRDGERLVTTNGCFDILHAGHLRTLRAARRLGERVIVGLNSDASVRSLKGDDRPVVGENDRAATLAALPWVDWVHVFAEATPEAMLRTVRPDVHVKGGDYRAADLPEHDLVTAMGGRIEIVPEVPGLHTSDVLAAYRRRAD